MQCLFKADITKYAHIHKEFEWLGSDWGIVFSQMNLGSSKEKEQSNNIKNSKLNNEY